MSVFIPVFDTIKMKEFQIQRGVVWYIYLYIGKYMYIHIQSVLQNVTGF
jgi:hypothetical protein